MNRRRKSIVIVTIIITAIAVTVTLFAMAIYQGQDQDTSTAQYLSSEQNVTEEQSISDVPTKQDLYQKQDAGQEQNAKEVIPTEKDIAIDEYTSVEQAIFLEEGVLMEMIIFPGAGRGHGARAYRFIVKDDGTFITYFAINHHERLQFTNENIMESIEERAEIALSDEDFQGITELLSVVEEIHGQGAFVWANTYIALLYNGNIYGTPNILTWEVMDVANEIQRLSPLTN